jgi:tRNA(fMet)-specific endonuclease VapC
LRRRPPVYGRVAAEHPVRLSVATMTVAELLLGAELSAQPEDNRDAIMGFVSALTVLDFDLPAAAAYAAIRAHLQRTGRLIGERDFVIAGVALTHGLTVVTGNTSEFARVPGLQVEDWSR